MSFREQLGQMRREYRRDIAQMVQKQGELEAKVDAGFERIGSQFELIGSQFEQIGSRFERIQLQLKAVTDEFSGLVSENHQLRADLLESSRNLTGRLRLTEDRLNKMLDLVESEVADPMADMLSRIEALERRTPPA